MKCKIHPETDIIKGTCNDCLKEIVAISEKASKDLKRIKEGDLIGIEIRNTGESLLNDYRAVIEAVVADEFEELAGNTLNDLETVRRATFLRMKCPHCVRSENRLADRLGVEMIGKLDEIGCPKCRRKFLKFSVTGLSFEQLLTLQSKILKTPLPISAMYLLHRTVASALVNAAKKTK